jgi:L-asparaginase/Glu-tRNA(Gln) amidotransferase subunit D
MHHRWIIGWLVWLLILSSGGTVAEAVDSQQVEGHKGLTVDDLTRGVRSAAQNIEKEIPKIGPAISKTVKSVAGNSSEKTQPQKPPSDKR